MHSVSRRGFFRIGLTASLATAAGSALTACSGGQSGASARGGCADPDALSPSENSLRTANHYVEKSADAAKTCAGCTFFTAATDGGPCGTCQIFTGGPANPQGYCDSWAANPAS